MCISPKYIEIASRIYRKIILFIYALHSTHYIIDYLIYTYIAIISMNNESRGYLYRFERSSASTSFVDNVVIPVGKSSETDSSHQTNTCNTHTDRRASVATHESVTESASLEASIVSPMDASNIRMLNYYPNFVIDPLSLIVKLAILGRKPHKTKVSIGHHCIRIHEAGPFQGIVRYYMNSTKQDLHHFLVPIENACERYIMANTYADKRELFVSLFQNAVSGLEKLLATYHGDSMVVLCLNHYINIIHNSISMGTIIVSKDHDDRRKYYNDAFAEKMREIWSPNKMDIALRLADCIHKQNGDVVRSLETFMEGVDHEVMRTLDNYCEIV